MVQKKVIGTEHGDPVPGCGEAHERKGSKWKAGYRGGAALLSAVDWLGEGK